MTIYVFSLLVGYEVSGVDSAQGNRDNFLKKTSYDRKYIFAQIPQEEYIQRYNNLGIKTEDMLSAHFMLAGQYDFSGNYKVSDKLKELEDVYGDIEISESDRYIHVFHDKKRIASIYLKENKEYLWKMDLYESERLIATEHYSDKIIYRDYYSTIREGESIYAKKTRISFFDMMGNIAYECICEDDAKDDVYVFNDGGRYNTSELMEMFIYKLDLKKDDIVLIDRPSNAVYVQPLFKNEHKAKIMPFLHSNHYFELNESNEGLYLNYEYYYWFKYSDRIDTFLVSTEEQKEELKERLEMYQCHVPKIEALFTGGLKELKLPDGERKSDSIITVSRLDARKKIDWIIMAVIKAHKRKSEIYLDIYGKGKTEYINYLKEIIAANCAEEYIHLKGHCNVNDIYKNYELYVSSSLWETLGLSVMEAVGSGNAVVGLDVHYGNRLFIEPGKNGALIDYDIHDPDYINKVDEITTNMANAIVEIMSDKSKLEQYHKHSYEIAKRYLSENIEKRWIEFLNHK